MAINELVYPSIIARMVMMRLKNLCPMVKTVRTELREEMVDSKIGTTIKVKKRIQYIVGTNPNITGSINKIKEATIDFTVDQWAVIPFTFTNKDLMMLVDGREKVFDENFIKPATEMLANRVERELCGVYKQIANYYGTPGTVPNTYAYILACRQRLSEQGVPRTDRHLVLDPETWASIVGALYNVYTPEVAKKAITEGIVDVLANFTLWEGQNIRQHANSGAQATVSVTTTLDKNSTLNQIEMTGLNYDIKEGDVFEINNVLDVNPLSKDALGYNKKFVATADVTYTGTADVITFSPAICMSDDVQQGGAYQNVDSYPVAAAAIYVNCGVVAGNSNNYANNLFYHKNAIDLVCVPVRVLSSSKGYVARDEDSGLSITIQNASDINTFEEIWRCDMFFGVKATQPELAGRLIG